MPQITLIDPNLIVEGVCLGFCEIGDVVTFKGKTIEGLPIIKKCNIYDEISMPARGVITSKHSGNLYTVTLKRKA